MAVRSSFCAFLVMALLTAGVQAEPVNFRTTDEAAPAYRVSTRVKATGKPVTSGGTGKAVTHTMTANAEFVFTERRLPAGGRDAQSLRAARDFQTARMQSAVVPDGDAKGEKAETSVSLPQHLQLIVAEGRLTGVNNYCPTSPMPREVVDLLELPGDPLALTALLPVKATELNEKWTPPEWAGQMLAAIEAIEKSTLSCELTAVTETTAKITVSGSVKGQRDGANCEVTVNGTVTYDRSREAISEAKLTYGVKSSIGAVSPGLDLTMEVETNRSLMDGAGRLTDKVLSAIPISAPAGAYDLVYDVAPWGLRLRHSRDWFFYKATVGSSPEVAIFRLMEQGALSPSATCLRCRPPRRVSMFLSIRLKRTSRRRWGPG